MNIDDKKWEILCSEEDIKQKTNELGNLITEDYQDKNLYVISLLRGSFIFCADLVRAIDLKLNINFMISSSYGDGLQTSGKVTINKDVEEDLTDYDVLLVDDIADSGLTLKHVMEHLKTKNPKSLKSCVLLNKPSRRLTDLEPDYCGFTIPDAFVVGYGLNYGDHYRNIPYVFIVTEEDRDRQEN
ncbi:MAG: hypoxanthine phosphoribosyltransferase [Tindallia sp. MSAO_Bac2]|nr:MAG: hypoxanthine phosphoribosyltransferase [Tindallia sp. MSAO_Bac2]